MCGCNSAQIGRRTEIITAKIFRQLSIFQSLCYPNHEPNLPLMGAKSLLMTVGVLTLLSRLGEIDLSL